MVFILEEVKEIILDFLHGTIREYYKCVTQTLDQMRIQVQGTVNVFDLI